MSAFLANLDEARLHLELANDCLALAGQDHEATAEQREHVGSLSRVVGVCLGAHEVGTRLMNARHTRSAA